MKRHVLDHLALKAGLAGTGSERERHEFSRLVHSATVGGSVLSVPALCLADGAILRPAIAGHVAALLADAPVGSLDVVGLTRTAQWSAVRAAFPTLRWPASHAVLHSLMIEAPIMTTDRGAYLDAPVEFIVL